jgi:hypothetical protein
VSTNFESFAARSKRSSRRPWELALLLLAAGGWVTPLSAAGIDEAAAKLGNDEFAIRESGEEFLRALTLDDLPAIEALTASADPEVAFRARRALLHVRLRMNDGFPAELARKLAELPELSRREARATMDQLLSLKPLPLLTMAGLHTEFLTKPHRYTRVDPNSINALSQTIIATAATKTQAVEMADIRPDLYRTETLALLVDGFAKLHASDPDKILPVYAAWAEKRESLVALLNGPSIKLEMARVESLAGNPNQQLPKLLTLAQRFPNPSEQRKVILARATKMLRENAKFPIDSLDRDQGYTLFAALEENWDPQMDMREYKKFRQRFPDPHPNPESSTLEAIYSLEKDGVNAALALALKQPKDHAAVWLGSHLQANPDEMPTPLVIPPLKKDQRRHEHLASFLNSLVPLRNLPDMEANPKAMAAFDALLRDEQWLETALQANVGRLVYFQWIRQGTLDANIPKHISNSTDRLRALGRLLVTKPESMAMIDPAHQSAGDLQKILLGMLEVTPIPRPGADTVFAQADEWVKVHPDLWKTEGFRYDIARAESLAPTRIEGLHRILKLATAYPEESPGRATALRSIRRYQEDALAFPTAKLSVDEGFLFFGTFGLTVDAKVQFGPAYLAFRKRFPGEHPGTATCPLETLAFLADNQPGKAFSLALTQDSTSAAQWVGEWLNENPEALDKPLSLPNLNNRPNEQCNTLLRALAPFDSLAEAKAHPLQMGVFKTLIDTPEWLDAALRSGNVDLVAYQFVLTDQLDQMLATRLSGRDEPLFQLGGTLAQTPETLTAIKPANQKLTDLRPLVTGLKKAQVDPAKRAAIDAIIASWTKEFPDLAIEQIEEQPEPEDGMNRGGNAGPRIQLQLQIR